MIQCALCQAKPKTYVSTIVNVRRFNYVDRMKVYFCDRDHAFLWKDGLKDRFVKWEKKSW